MVWLLLFGGAFGGVVASAVQCFAERYLVGGDWVRGRSVCDGCGRGLKGVWMVPVFSFLAQRGRARCCGERLSWLYVVVEVVGVALGAWLAWSLMGVVGDGVKGDALLVARVIASYSFGVGLLYLIVTDIRAFYLSPKVMFGLAVLAVFVNGLRMESVVGMVIGVIFIGIPWVVTRGKGMGWGDVLLGLVLGMYFGWSTFPILFLSYVTASVIALVLLSRKTMLKSDPFPFGAVLALCGILAIVTSCIFCEPLLQSLHN